MLPSPTTMHNLREWLDSLAPQCSPVTIVSSEIIQFKVRLLSSMETQTPMAIYGSVILTLLKTMRQKMWWVSSRHLPQSRVLRLLTISPHPLLMAFLQLTLPCSLWTSLSTSLTMTSFTTTLSMWTLVSSKLSEWHMQSLNHPTFRIVEDYTQVFYTWEQIASLL